jgi:hypothetical protein
MKIYINNYNPQDILKKIKLIDQYFSSKKNNTEIISDDGIFYIDEKRFYKVNIISDELVKLRSNNLELLLDKSVYNNDIVHQVPFDHIDFHITTFYYAVNSNKFNKFKIKLVVEGNYDVSDNKVIDKDKIIINKYHNFSPTNFYFEAPNEKTEFEILNNDDLNVFLSLLN